MAKKPVDYKQYDSRWSAVDYSAKGESKTIKSSGCGITCSAMVIASLKDKNVTPVETAKWSKAHGYKYLNQGTAYGYFKPQFAVYGIKCEQLNSTNAYHNKTATVHKTVKAELEKGNWIIAVMGVGRWTSGGHYVLAYALENGYVYINDPASTQANRLKAKIEDWQYEVKYYWKIEVPESYYKYIPTKTIAKDSSKEDIKWLQENLNKCLKDVKDFVPLVIDGSYGNKTKTAVLIYWRQLKWNLDGKNDGTKAGTKTINALASGRTK